MDRRPTISKICAGLWENTTSHVILNTFCLMFKLKILPMLVKFMKFGTNKLKNLEQVMPKGTFRAKFKISLSSFLFFSKECMKKTT